MTARVTDHGDLRIRKRVGVSRKAVDNVAQRALEQGITHSETAGSLKRFLDGLYLKHKKPNNLRVYGRQVYLFRGDVLITVIDLPHKYHSTVDKINRKRVSE